MSRSLSPVSILRHFARWLAELIQPDLHPSGRRSSRTRWSAASPPASPRSTAIALRRLVIYGTPGSGRTGCPSGCGWWRSASRSVRPSERGALRALGVLRPGRGPLPRRPGWFDAFSDYTRARAGVPHVKRTMRQLIGSCTKQIDDAELRRIPIPTELLWGRHDRFVPLGLAEAASARLGWPLRVIDDGRARPPYRATRGVSAALSRHSPTLGARHELPAGLRDRVPSRGRTWQSIRRSPSSSSNSWRATRTARAAVWPGARPRHRQWRVGRPAREARVEGDRRRHRGEGASPSPRAGRRGGRATCASCTAT